MLQALLLLVLLLLLLPLQLPTTAAVSTRRRAAAERAAGNPAGRFGEPEEFGELCAYLCSVQASYITGQNILIDGGAFPGTL